MLERQVSLVTTKQHRTHRLDKIHVVSSLHHRSKTQSSATKIHREREKERDGSRGTGRSCSTHNSIEVRSQRLSQSCLCQQQA